MHLRGIAPPEVVIRPGETVVVVGLPGYGKTTLAEWLARDCPSSIVYSTKGDADEEAGWEAAGYVRCTSLEALEREARALLVVRPRWLDRRSWDRLECPWGLALEHPFNRVPSALIFDEVLNVFPSQGGHPGTARLLQQGRSRGHVPIILSQLANHIDTRLLRLCHHLVVMGPCRNRDDLGYLERATLCSTARLAHLGRRQVAWWRQGDDRWRCFDVIDHAGPRVLRPLFPVDPNPYAEAPARGRWPWSRMPAVEYLVPVRMM
jgi:hypothetical protein